MDPTIPADPNHLTPEEQQRLQLDMDQLNAMNGDPARRQTLIHGQYTPQRLRQFELTQDNDNRRLQSQLEFAQRLMATPIEYNGQNNVASVANLVANALRGFGGMALSMKKEKEISDTNAANDARHQSLVGDLERGAGAGLDFKTQGIQDALRRYGRYPGGDGAI